MCVYLFLLDVCTCVYLGKSVCIISYVYNDMMICVTLGSHFQQLNLLASRPVFVRCMCVCVCVCVCIAYCVCE
jgi:hypothetical protein